jgi:hypothetical protein
MPKVGLIIRGCFVASLLVSVSVLTDCSSLSSRFRKWFRSSFLFLRISIVWQWYERHISAFHLRADAAAELHAQFGCSVNGSRGIASARYSEFRL